jgi:hypothetical protein
MHNMVVALGGPQADFHYQGFNFHTMKPFDDRWKEADAAGLAAVILYWSYKRFGDDKYLEAAKWSLDFLERIDYNPIYEVGIDSAIYAASRINAETGSNYNIEIFKVENRACFRIKNRLWNGQQ